MVPTKINPLRETVLLSIIGINLFIATIDAQIFTPAFPYILMHFSTDEMMVQSILSTSFIGFCIGALFCGPLSDSLGRKKIIVIGSLIYTLGGIGCIFSKSIEDLIFWRFVQGPGAAFTLIVSGTAVFDLFKKKTATEKLALLYSIASMIMAVSAILGSWLSMKYGWRGTFAFSALFSLVALLGAIFLLPETIREEDKKPFRTLSILKDYFQLLRSWAFIGYSLICSFMFAALIVYMSNLSFIFVMHLKVPMMSFGYYQAAVTASFVVSSFLTSRMLKVYDAKLIKKLGMATGILGAVSLIFIEYYEMSSALIITAGMAVTVAGTGFVFSLFVSDFMSLFPKIKGAASSMALFIRLVIASAGISLGSLLFDGTIVPVATLVSSMLFVSLLLYYLLEKRSRA